MTNMRARSHQAAQLLYSIDKTILNMLSCELMKCNQLITQFPFILYNFNNKHYFIISHAHPRITRFNHWLGIQYLTQSNIKAEALIFQHTFLYLFRYHSSYHHHMHYYQRSCITGVKLSINFVCQTKTKKSGEKKTNHRK